MADRLIVRGAREHNLKDVSLDLPRDALIVFTGLSGSGKSSLAFDTIFAEGQRRYVESLSAYARQFLGQMDKPDVDFIEGLSPAVSIDQKSTSRNPRSTVGTITEVYDYLRLLYARIGRPHCPVCGKPIARQTPQQIVDRVLELEQGARFQVLAPVIRGRKGEYLELFKDLQSKGYARARVDGVVVALTEPPVLKKQEKHTIEVVVDRLAVKASAKRRLTDSVETALGLSGGLVVLDFVDLPEDDPHRERTFSEHLACLDDDLSFEELEPRSFSFNSPYGACVECHGLGTRMEVDPELLIPDARLSLRDGALAPWAGTGSTSDYFARLVDALADALGFRTDVAWEKLPAKARKAVLNGHDQQVHVRYQNRFGRERSYYTAFEGVIPYVQRRHAEAESDTSRERFEGYMRQVAVPGVRRRAAQADRARGDHRRAVDRRGRLDADRRVRALPRGLGADARASRRSPSACSRRSTSGCGSCSTSASTTSPSTGPRAPSPAARPSGSGSRPRSAPAWSACCTSSTSRASGCTSATTTG